MLNLDGLTSGTRNVPNYLTTQAARHANLLTNNGRDMQSIQPRGLRRAAAAAYLGISPAHFDKQRALGVIPAPRSMFGVELYDRAELDLLFDGTPTTPQGHGQVADNDNDSDYWDRECAAIGNRNT